MKEIFAALVKAQKEFGPALKTSSNPHFRTKYAALDACIEAVIDALNNNGIMLMQQTHLCEDGVIVETTFIHDSGQTFSGGKLHVPAAKHDPQGYGSALTYARRYSLMATCGISAEDDDGNAASRVVEQKTTSNVNPSQMADHLAAIEASANSEELSKAYAAAFASCDGDAVWQAKVIAAKKARVERAKKEKEEA